MGPSINNETVNGDINRTESKPENLIVEEAGIEIGDIVLNGSTIIKEKEVAKLLAPYKYRKLSAEDINRLLNDIQTYYIKRGYVTTRAYLEPPKQGSNTLSVLVIEGKLESIVLEDNMDQKSVNLDVAFHGITGKLFNLGDIERGLEIINNLPSNNATMEILPGSEMGLSVLKVKNTHKNPVQYLISYSTDYTDGTWNYKDNPVSVTTTMDNPFGLMDSLSVSTSIPIFFDKEKFTLSANANYSLPWGLWKFGLSSSFSQSRTIYHLEYTDPENIVTNTSLQLFINRRILKSPSGFGEISADIDTKNSYTYINGSLINISSYAITNGETGFKYNGFIFGGMWNVSTNLRIGIDPKYFSLEGPVEGQFDRGIDFNYKKVLSSIGFQLPLNLQPVTRISLSGSVNGQIPFLSSNLPGSEQFTVDSVSNVRAIRSEQVSGDTGYAFQSELSFQPYFLQNVFGSDNQFNLYARYDGGALYGENAVSTDFVSGWGYGARLMLYGCIIDFTHSFPLNYPSSLNQPPAERIDLSLSAMIPYLNINPKNYTATVYNSDGWYTATAFGLKQFFLNSVYIADGVYSTDAYVYTMEASLGRKLENSWIYVDAAYSLPNDNLSFISCALHVDSKLLRYFPVYPFIGFSAGYGKYQDANLDTRNPTFIIKKDNKDLKSTIDLEGILFGIEAGIGFEYKRFELLGKYSVQKLLSRETLYWDGIAEHFEINFLQGFSLGIGIKL